MDPENLIRSDFAADSDLPVATVPTYLSFFHLSLDIQYRTGTVGTLVPGFMTTLNFGKPLIFSLTQYEICKVPVPYLQ